jgi:nicotinamidase/pyrazinamidase
LTDGITHGSFLNPNYLSVIPEGSKPDTDPFHKAMSGRSGERIADRLASVVAAPDVPLPGVTWVTGMGLVVVDVQNDFADPAGSLSVAGGAEIVPLVNELVDDATLAGVPVAYTQDWHPPTTPHFAKDGGVWPVHCVAGSWGAELHPDLRIAGDVIRKGVAGEDGYSGFTVRDPVTGETASTGLAELLRARDVERVVVVGLATDYCVKATALDAIELGFDVEVLRAAVAAVDVEPGDGDRALDELVAAGVEVS